MQPKGFLVGIGVGGHFSWWLISGCHFCLGAYFREEGILESIGSQVKFYVQEEATRFTPSI